MLQEASLLSSDLRIPFAGIPESFTFFRVQESNRRVMFCCSTGLAGAMRFITPLEISGRSNRRSWLLISERIGPSTRPSRSRDLLRAISTPICSSAAGLERKRAPLRRPFESKWLPSTDSLRQDPRQARVKLRVNSP